MKNAAEMKEKFLPFMLDSDEVQKKDFITAVSKNIANTLCRTDCVSQCLSIFLCSGIHI